MNIRAVGGRYEVAGTCQWCGERYRNSYGSRQQAARARYCSRDCVNKYRASKRNHKTPEIMPLAATRPRKNRRYPYAKLNRRQVQAAYMLYQDGWSVERLAREGWQKWGYASEVTATNCLYLAFYKEGYKLRKPGEARHLWHLQNGCGNCGCPSTEWTRGCGACKERNYYRRKAGLPFAPRATRGVDCAACGCHHDERTIGCKSCNARHSYRRRREMEVAA